MGAPFVCVQFVLEPLSNPLRKRRRFCRVDGLDILEVLVGLWGRVVVRIIHEPIIALPGTGARP